MPTWNEIEAEIDKFKSTAADHTIAKACDAIRSKYLQELREKTGRTVIAYYSGFLQKRSANGQYHPEASITDLDMNGFMTVVHGVDRRCGLD